jgi:hypothetical protein
MSLLGSLGLAAAERLERSVSPAVALRSYKALLAADDRSVVLPAALGALRCALALPDPAELEAMCAYWETLVQVAGWPAIRDQVKSLCAAGRLAEARLLASAEALRTHAPRAHYLRARVLELAGASGEAEQAFRTTAAFHAQAPAIAAAARAWLIERLAARGAVAEELAADIDLSAARPRHRVTLARARLHAPSRFARAAALSVLEELARGADRDVARLAVQAAARHADDLGEALTWVEADRVEAALATWPDPAERAAAVARLASRRRREVAGDALGPLQRDHLDRVRAALQGFSLGPASDNPDPEVELANLTFPAVAALVRGVPADALDALAVVASRLRARATGATPSAVWTVTLLALASGDGRAAKLGLELLALLLERASERPPRGFSAYAAPARAAGNPDLEVVALRRAAAAGEPDAASLLAAALIRRAWRAAARNLRDEALALFHEARKL